MKRDVVLTGDGTSTLYIKELGEHYHSHFGALTESMHVFILAGFCHTKCDPIKVLEYGMGTGLNVMLTHRQAIRDRRTVHYHAVEKYPVKPEEVKALNLTKDTGISPWIVEAIHHSEWNSEIRISDNFTLYKERADFRESEPGGDFDVIYFDAFAPSVQPELWSAEMFSRVAACSVPGTILTTYSSRGQVKRNLASAGFSVEKLPGPPGKREFIRATMS